MIKQVICMRTDLNMRKGKMCSQAAHAAMMFMSRNFEKLEHNSWLFQPTPEQREWLNGSFTKICVGVSDEETLNLVEQRAKEAGLEVHIMTDNGTTEFHGVPTRTCLAIGPDHAEKIDKITGSFKLL